MTKNKLSHILISFGMLILLASCATVKIFNDAGLKNETGLRFYSPKPYLLVDYQSAKAGSVKTSIIYLPDLAAPQYLKIQPGFGSSALKLELNNGILTSYGLTTDSKMPETIDKISDLLTKSTSVISEIPKAKTVGETNQPAFELFEIVIADGQTKLIPVK